jgi:adenine-specific DNA-methyltransferase
MIYIDPPYNTGNDFIYPDNYSESLETYLRYTGQVDNEGRKYSSNTEADGRFHSKWLNMMYPRLYLARNLLREDGVLFVSIDEHEIENLRRLCNEIFGEENFIGTIVWKGATDNNPTQIAMEHEYLLCFGRSKESVEGVWKNASEDAKETLLAEFQRIKTNPLLSESDIQKDVRGFIKANKEALAAVTHYDRVDSKGLYTGSRKVHNPKPGGYKYDVLHPGTNKVCVPPVNGYRYPKERMDQLIEQERILFGEDETQIIQIKEYLEDYEGKLSSVVHLDSRTGSNELNALFGVQKLFPNPKPVSLLKSIFEFVVKPGELVLDFFGGSGSSAHAVLDLNKQDQGNRKFILVQLPEPTDRKDFPTIADITKERVRLVIKKLNDEDAGKRDSENGGKQDRGFKVFKLQSSNFKTWNGEVPKEPAALAQQLEMHVRHIVEGRTPEDLLYEILLKSGFPPTTPIETLTLADKTVFSIAEGAMLICLEKTLTPEVIKSMADRKPERVVCLDEGFAGNDQLKTNAVQTMKTKGVTSFRTV